MRTLIMALVRSWGHRLRPVNFAHAPLQVEHCSRDRHRRFGGRPSSGQAICWHLSPIPDPGQHHRNSNFGGMWQMRLDPQGRTESPFAARCTIEAFRSRLKKRVLDRYGERLLLVLRRG
jgi:hypothetical protein